MLGSPLSSQVGLYMGGVLSGSADQGSKGGGSLYPEAPTRDFFRRGQFLSGFGLAFFKIRPHFIRMGSGLAPNFRGSSCGPRSDRPAPEQLHFRVLDINHDGVGCAGPSLFNINIYSIFIIQ
jgi:hypothetical protein